MTTPLPQSVQNGLQTGAQNARTMWRTLSQQRWFYPVAGGLLLLVIGMYMYDRYTSPTRSITVVGVGTKTVKPASATVSFSLVYGSDNRGSAITEGERRFQSILDSIGSYNPTEINKTAYQVIENARTTTLTTGLNRLNSYQYVNAARITVEDPNIIANLSNALYEAGATTVTQIRYIPENEEKVDNELRGLAVRDAKERAKKMAAGAGTRLGRVLLIQEGQSTGQTGTPVTQTAGLAQTTTNEGNTAPTDSTTGTTQTITEVGDIELTAIASVTFELW